MTLRWPFCICLHQNGSHSQAYNRDKGLSCGRFFHSISNMISGIFFPYHLYYFSFENIALNIQTGCQDNDLILWAIYSEAYSLKACPCSNIAFLMNRCHESSFSLESTWFFEESFSSQANLCLTLPADMDMLSSITTSVMRKQPAFDISKLKTTIAMLFFRPCNISQILRCSVLWELVEILFRLR